MLYNWEHKGYHVIGTTGNTRDNWEHKGYHALQLGIQGKRGYARKTGVCFTTENTAML